MHVVAMLCTLNRIQMRSNALFVTRLPEHISTCCDVGLSAQRVHFTSCTAARLAHDSCLESADFFFFRFLNGASEALWTGAEAAGGSGL